ncbi:MAG: class I SAM-dependent methyltransferase [Candidatus Lokiarchaeota archaeon]|nr:class I SAM-dependent methyltransferase [Candidatus Lokiarchaeota archaeon]
MPRRNIAEKYAEMTPGWRKPLWTFFHWLIQTKDRNHRIRFMNYGYIDQELSSSPIQLTEEDAVERFCVNLYHQNVSDINLQGKEVLEVGCGRGGGADYISRYMKPKTYVGLDLNKKVIKACNRTFTNPGLSFVQGCADDLPFEDEKFDAVVNVESSRCYPDMMGFLTEVKRVLKPGGHLLFSDMRYTEDHMVLKSQFEEAGFELLVEKNILPNVVEALEVDDVRRKNWIRKRIKSKFLLKTSEEFSGTVGSRRYQLFKDGKMGYWHFVLQKSVD